MRDKAVQNEGLISIKEYQAIKVDYGQAPSVTGENSKEWEKVKASLEY